MDLLKQQHKYIQKINTITGEILENFGFFKKCTESISFINDIKENLNSVKLYTEAIRDQAIKLTNQMEIIEEIINQDFFNEEPSQYFMDSIHNQEQTEKQEFLQKQNNYEDFYDYDDSIPQELEQVCDDI